MRSRVGAIATGLAAVLIASVAVASSSNYKDSFAQATYTGSNGSLEWPSETPWTEVNDDGSSSSGKVQATSDGNCPDGNCLAIRSSALTLQGVGAARAADLGVFADASLKYQMKVVLGILPTDATLAVQGWDGASWQTLDSHVLALSGGLSSRSIPLASSYLDDSFKVQYVVSGLLNGDVYVDHVELVGTLVPTATTSTTTTSTTSTTTLTTLPVSTTLPTVTTSPLPPLLTSSTSSSTTTTTENTTSGGSSDTTTTISSSTSDDDGHDATTSDQTAATTTTTPDETSTTEDESTVIPPVEPPDDPGLRQGSIGLQIGYQNGRLGEIASSPDLVGVAIEPSYTMAVEIFESSWGYLLVLLLVIATAIVSGIDRRRMKKAKHGHVGQSTWFTHRTA